MTETKFKKVLLFSTVNHIIKEMFKKILTVFEIISVS